MRILRAVISLSLLTFLIWKAHPRTVVQTVFAADKMYIALAVPLFVFTILVSIVKWNVILQMRAVRVPFRRLLNCYLVGLFAGNFLPSRYGGDLVRIYDITKTVGDGVKAASSVVIERLSGLLVLLLLGLIGAVASYSRVQDPRIVLFCSLLLGSAVLLVASLRTKWWVPIVAFVDRLLKTDKLKRLSWELRESIQACQSRPTACLLIIILSFTFHIGAIIVIFCYGQALRFDVPFVLFVTFVPVVYLLEALPISLNGLGIREGAFVYLFGKAGVTTPDALSLAIVILAMQILTSVVGGIVFAFQGWSGGSGPTSRRVDKGLSGPLRQRNTSSETNW